MKKSNSSLILIIGLPGSGKSVLAEECFNEYLFFDDFIFRLKNEVLLNYIKSDLKLCLADPRLCIPSIFDKIIKFILKYVKKSNIKLILFENDIKSCMINSKMRKNKKSIEKSIKYISTYYNIEYYKNYKHEIIPVYNSKNYAKYF